jgi:hypothetical protein
VELGTCSNVDMEQSSDVAKNLGNFIQLGNQLFREKLGWKLFLTLFANLAHQQAGFQTRFV